MVLTPSRLHSVERTLTKALNELRSLVREGESPPPPLRAALHFRRGERRAEVMDLLAEPRTSVELAEAMGLTRAGVLKWLNRLIEEGKVEAVGGRHSSPLRRYRRVASEERASRSHPRQSGSALASDRKVLERLSQMSSVDRILLALELGERDRMLRG